MPVRISIALLIFLAAVSCARQGSPSGGPKDETPPRFLSATPDTLSLNVAENLEEIKINFDEFIVLKDQQNNVVVSPSMGSNVIFQPMGTASRTVRIKLNEPLKPNTTYNINFGNAIADNNEGNVLPGFQYVFSTGDYIDSLEISGKTKIVSERTLPKNLVVGLYPVDSAYSDSIIFTNKPFYVARPTEDGSFKLNYLHPGKYRMIAFNDEVQNLQFDSGKEKIGFIPEPIELDSSQTRDIFLFDQLPAYRAEKAEQKGYGHLVFKFSGQPDSIELEPMDYVFSSSEISYVPRSDSLNFWFNPGTDSITETSKRINFLVRHQNRLDTVSAVYSNLQKYDLKISSKQPLGTAPGRPPKLTANYPIVALDSDFALVTRDSLTIRPELIPDPKDSNSFTVSFPIDLNKKYDVELYPGAVTDFFGKTNDSLKFSFSIRNRNDFGNLRLKLGNPPVHPFFLMLFNDKDELLDEVYTSSTEFEYNYLPPGKYYFKLLVDENENGFWDTGDFFSRRFPEPAWVYPQLIQVRAMWDTDETWLLPGEETDGTQPETDSMPESESSDTGSSQSEDDTGSGEG